VLPYVHSILLRHRSQQPAAQCKGGITSESTFNLRTPPSRLNSSVSQLLAQLSLLPYLMLMSNTLRRRHQASARTFEAIVLAIKPSFVVPYRNACLLGVSILSTLISFLSPKRRRSSLFGRSFTHHHLRRRRLRGCSCFACLACHYLYQLSSWCCHW